MREMLNMSDLMYLVLAAFAVVGTIAWIKNLVKSVILKDWQYVAYSFLVLGFSVALALLGSSSLPQALTVSFVILALVELGYQMIIKTILTVVAKLSGEPMSDNVTQIIDRIQDTVTKMGQVPIATTPTSTVINVHNSSSVPEPVVAVADPAPVPTADVTQEVQISDEIDLPASPVYAQIDPAAFIGGQKKE